MFERIVAAVDSDPERSTKVVEATTELGNAFGSQVLVVHVREVERSAAMVSTAKAGAIPPSLHFESEEEAKELVDTAVDYLRAEGVIAWFFGVNAERKSLEDIATPLTAVSRPEGQARAPAT